MPFVSIVSQLILVGLSVDICNLKYINMQSAAFAQSLSKLLIKKIKNIKKKKKKKKKKNSRNFMVPYLTLILF